MAQVDHELNDRRHVCRGWRRDPATEGMPTWVISVEDEQTPNVMDLLDRVTETGACVPSLWPLEVLNALLISERRKRLDSMRRQRLAGFLRRLPITLDMDTAHQGSHHPTGRATPAYSVRRSVLGTRAASLPFDRHLGRGPYPGSEGRKRDTARKAKVNHVTFGLQKSASELVKTGADAGSTDRFSPSFPHLRLQRRESHNALYVLMQA